MKHKLILLLSAVALLLPQAMKAQGDNGLFVEFHEKDGNPLITSDIKPENLIKAILDDDPDGDEFMIREGTWMELQRKVTDSFGNVHVTYNQKSDPNEFSDYQLILHFRPDGSLYYKNGTIVLQEKETALNTKARNSVSRISAERAAVIATGSPLSETVKTIANHEDKPRDAYKVKDVSTMQYVYVDAHSGDVLYTIPLLHSLAPWGDVKGSAVTLSANTSYNGLQELTMMQTDKGYILRDPQRNIITIDATDVLADRDSTNTPEERAEQYKLIMDSCDDATFTDKEELLNQEYSTSLRSFTVWLDPETEKIPDSLKLNVYYADYEDFNFVKDVINVDVKDIAWTDDNGRKKYTITFEDRPSINLIDFNNCVNLTMNGGEYALANAIFAGNRIAYNMYKDEEETNVECLLDVEVKARQLAIDVHWAIQKIYDMYEEYYGIKGCDGEGCQIVNIVNPCNTMPVTMGYPFNANAAGIDVTDSHGETSYIMLYGAGGTELYRPLTCLDVVAHEFTHNVTAGCCNNLLYRNESGALNEALADCMAMVAEDYLYGEPTWIIAEKIVLYGDNMRSFSDPWYSGSKGDNISEDNARPKYYGGEYWIDYTAGDPNEPKPDFGGVHYNSGVFNHLFYLLCEGGMGLTNEKGETRDIYPVGMNRMKDIIFHDMRYYNACLCNYAEIADNLMMAIEDLYGDNKEAISDLQNKFLTAYRHVGMESEMFPTAVTNVQFAENAPDSRTYNLYGVPVGEDYKGVVIKGGKKFIKK